MVEFRLAYPKVKSLLLGYARLSLVYFIIERIISCSVMLRFNFDRVMLLRES